MQKEHPENSYFSPLHNFSYLEYDDMPYEEIIECCKSGYSLGFRTFVLQGGEDAYFTDEILCELVKNIKNLFPDCAITLSLGERSRESIN